jgi:hypothetical protein
MLGSLLAVSLVLPARAPAPAEAWTNQPLYLHAKDGGYFDAHEGPAPDRRVVLVVDKPRPDKAWRFKKASEGYTIRLEDPRDEGHGWYLTCDPQDPGKGVYLSAKPGRGSYWKLRRTGGAKDRPADFRATLQATAGKATDWYLSSKDELITVRDKARETYRGRLLTLSEKPRAPGSEWHITSQAP